MIRRRTRQQREDGGSAKGGRKWPEKADGRWEVSILGGRWGEEPVQAAFVLAAGLGGKEELDQTELVLQPAANTARLPASLPA